MTSFYRLSGAGNDFLALVEPATAPAAEQIRAWCRRGLSAGADGLFVLRRAARGADMEYFNADGLAAELCLNGTRCAARLALELGWAERQLVIGTGTGPVKARRTATAEIALELPAPEPPDCTLELELDGRALTGWWLAAGVPHFVLPWDEPLARAPVAELGPRLRRHPAFGDAGANVDFVRFPASDRLEIRTYERGVEAETLACGSGVLAAAAVGLAEGRLGVPLVALTAGGFLLTVDRPAPGTLSLAGDTRLIARGELTDEAAELPPPPAWSD